MRATSIAMLENPQLHGLFLGIDGTVARWGSGEIQTEAIDTSEDGPQNFGDLREIRAIDDQAYVVGMGRTAYARSSAGTWTRIDHGLREPDNEDRDCGLNSIDGFSTSELITVGWDGEIWMGSPHRWQQIDSPTNLTLNKVLCLPGRTAIACGQKGTLLVYSKGHWTRVQHDETSDDFWGVSWFRGSVYLSTLNAIFRWNDRCLKRVEVTATAGCPAIEVAAKDSFFRLHTDGEVMWSIGRKMACYTEDGLAWTEPIYS
jgi:hypothetical protein